MMQAKLSNIHILRDFSGKWRLEATVEAEQVKPLQSFLEELKDRFASAELKAWREKRSLDANAYAWKLMTMIADTLTLAGATVTKDDVYLGMLKRYGQGDIVKVRPDKAELILREFPYKEPHEKLYTEKDQYWRVWVGSSNYDTREMSIFINGIIEDAKELGIETATPEELEKLMAAHEARYGKASE